jgi:hypothetical protein
MRGAETFQNDSFSAAAPTIAGFLAALPPDRAAELQLVRGAIRTALPEGYEEAVAGKVIAYQVPLSMAVPCCFASSRTVFASRKSPVLRDGPRLRSAVHPSRVL